MAFNVTLATGSAFLEGGSATLLYVLQRETQGSTSAKLEIKLPRNAVVDKYDLVVEARRADVSAVADVAQVRVNASTDSTLPGRASSIVVDFGTPRTVSGVEVPSGLQIVRVKAWVGASFSNSAAYHAGLSGASVSPKSPSTATRSVLDSEVRTERLLVEVLGSANATTIGQTMFVLLPEAPAGLELRIDGGAPIWTYPGPAQQGSGAALSDTAWSQDGKIVVHAGPALAALTGDPTKPDTEEVTFEAVLTTRVPGILGIGEGDKSLGRVRRLAFSGQHSKDEVFAAEGQLTIPLTGATLAGEGVQEVRFTMLATVPPERVLPPLGPDPGDAADLILDTNRAACVFLASNQGLVEITAIRLPITVTSDGADARVVLWSADPITGEPKAPFPNGTTQPVAIPGDKTDEAWTTFPFKKPVPWKPPDTFWAALIVTRGQLISNLGRSAGAADPIDTFQVRRGAPAGPWRVLPAQDSAVLSGLRGRIRVAGHAAREAPIAPFIVSLGLNSTEVTPTPKGIAGKIAFSIPWISNAPALRIVSRVAGTVTIQDVDVVSRPMTSVSLTARRTG